MTRGPVPAARPSAPAPALPGGPAALGELLTPTERRDQAAEAGYQVGYAAGVAAARREWQDRVDDAKRTVDALQSRFGSLAAALDAAIAENRRAAAGRAEEVIAGLGDAACRLAEAVLGRELAADPAPVLGAVLRALGAAPEGPAVVSVHPDDLAVVTAAWPGSDRLVFSADPGVELGGAVLRAGAATVDARISAALERAGRALAEARTGPGAAVPA